MARHRCFISYHADDQAAVDDFISSFDDIYDVFIKRGVTMPEDVINSDDTPYVMRRIRELYLKDSTVTVVLIGACTWARKYVDWEVQASLRQPADGYPNGLLAILLPNRTSGTLPNRVKLNVDSGYAKFYSYPAGPATLSGWIDDAYNARFDKAYLINNPRDRFSYNRHCG
jgi:hypothetical protein